jgi:hypothetical protein
MSKGWLEPRSHGSSSLRLGWLRLPPTLKSAFTLCTADLGSSQDRPGLVKCPMQRAYRLPTYLQSEEGIWGGGQVSAASVPGRQ